MRCHSTTSDRIAVRRRADLVVSVQRQHGQTVYVLKDPLSLRYFRLEEHEYAMFQMLDGRTTFSRITDRVSNDFPQLLLGEDDVREFVASLYQHALVIGQRTEQGVQLKKRSDRARQQRRRQLLRNVLAIRCPGVDPTRLLDGLYPCVAWFFTGKALLAVAALAIIALAVVAIHAAEITGELIAMHQYFGPGNWLLLALTLATTKILHELGHALACRRFGGECHEIGVMLLVLTPCLYCDVSDSWLLPNRWQRAGIAAAGMYVEVALASLATLIWANSEPGSLHYLALQVMLICSVSTLFFNGNPFARYDGYYILADIADVPNLREEARKALAAFLWRTLLGVPSDETRRRSWKLILFGCGVAMYRWVLLTCILWFLYQVLAAQGLEVVWQFLAGTTLFAAAVVPLWRFATKLINKEVRRQMKRRYVLVTATTLTGIASAVLLAPLPDYVRGPAELRVADAAPVYAPHSARLVKLLVQPGQHVALGESLANLDSVDLRLEVARLDAAVRSHETLLNNLKYERYENPQAAAAVPQAEELLSATKSQLQQRQRDLAQFQLTAPRSGVVLAAARRQSMVDDSMLAAWSGSPLDGKNRDIVLAQGDVVCEIGDPRQVEAELIVDQVNVEQLQVGQPVQLVLEAEPWRRLHGEVREISRQKLDATPESLTIQAGGSIASRVDQHGTQRPISASYTVRVQLDEENGTLHPGLRGRAKIHTGSQTIASLAWQTLCRTFHFGL